MVIKDDRNAYNFIKQAELKPLQIAEEIARRNEFNLVSVEHYFSLPNRYILRFDIEADEKIYECSLIVVKATMLNCVGEEAECWRHVYGGVVRRENRSIEETVKYGANVIDKIEVGIGCRGQYGTARRKEISILPGTPAWFEKILIGKKHKNKKNRNGKKRKRGLL